jgi:hypothetical protein
LKGVWRDTSWPHRAAIGGCVLLLGAMVTTLALSGCASTEQGIAREEVLYRAGTNVVATVQAVTPYLPPPVGSVVEGVLALATAALAAWNTHLHSQVKTLRNGNGNGAKASTGAGPSAPALTPT